MVRLHGEMPGPNRTGSDFLSNADGVVGKPIHDSWKQLQPGEENTTPNLVYEASQRLVEAGLSVIPIDAEMGTKSPDSQRLPRPRDRVSGAKRPSWSIYKMRRPNANELRRWHEFGVPYGLAVVCGAVSGGAVGTGLEVIDFDTADYFAPWFNVVEQTAPELMKRLVRVHTPRPGMHVYYRCSRFNGSQKLAFAAATDDSGHAVFDLQGQPVRKTLIELKGEGGYCLIPPSPSRCHPTGRLYRYVHDKLDLTRVPTITPEERAILLDAARSFNQWKDPKPSPKSKPMPTRPSDLSRPGDDYNARATWDDLLSSHGWTRGSVHGDETRWCRPGKDGGVSATTNHNGSDLLHVFSSSASPFEADQTYSKFAAYAMLNHDGNFTEASRALRKMGYGTQALPAGRRT